MILIVEILLSVAIAGLIHELGHFYAGESSDFQWLDGFAGISKRGWMWVDILVMCGAFWWGIYKIIMKVI